MRALPILAVLCLAIFSRKAPEVRLTEDTARDPFRLIRESLMKEIPDPLIQDKPYPGIHEAILFVFYTEAVQVMITTQKIVMAYIFERFGYF